MKDSPVTLVERFTLCVIHLGESIPMLRNYVFFAGHLYNNVVRLVFL